MTGSSSDFISLSYEGDEFLKQLREEGCKLIKWSDDLKSQIPSHGCSNIASNNSLNDYKDNLSHVFNTNNTFIETSMDKGDQESNNLLRILYNNYKFILKKYEELNEQKMSYIEGIKEYQYKLDNSNYMLQLQKKQLISMNVSNNLNNSLLEDSLNKQQLVINREKELLVERENKVAELEKELSLRESQLAQKGDDLVERENKLLDKEVELSNRQNELAAREIELYAKLAEFKEQKDSFNQERLDFATQQAKFEENKATNTKERKDASIFVEEHDLLVFKKVEDPEYSPKESTVSPFNGVVEDENKEFDSTADNDAIDALYIQNMNASSDDFHIFKKNMLNKMVLKKCQLRIENGFLTVATKSDASKYKLKDVTRLDVGYDSQAYKLYKKMKTSDDGKHSWNYLTIHTGTDKVINLYCNSVENGQTWYSGLNKIVSNNLSKSPSTDSLKQTVQPDEKSLMKIKYRDELHSVSSSKMFTKTIENTILQPLK